MKNNINNKIDLINKIQNFLIFLICSVIIFILCFFNKQFLVFLGGITKGIIIDKDTNIKNAIICREEDYNENFHMKYTFLEVYGAYAKISDFRKLNDRYKMDNGMLHLPKTSFIKNVVEENAQKVVELKEILEKKDIPLIFVKFPVVTANENVTLPVSIIEKFPELSDIFEKYVRERGVEFYNYDYLVTKEDIKKLFFSTDHHWKPYLALQTYSEMGKMLIDEYGIDIDTKSLDVNNYNIDVYKNSFLGSHGKRTGKIYAGLDDFEIIYPKFETKLKVNLCGFEREGDYEKTMINRRHLSNKDIYNVNTFSTYANSGLQSKVENLMTNSSSNIFLITDSYSMPSICFMSTGVKYLEQVDLRYVDENYLLKESILEAKPDIVIIQYNPGAFTDNKLFNFN